MMDNVVRTEPSKLRNGKEKRVLHYTAPVGRRESKRLKVAAPVSEFSPDCGSISKRLRSRTKVPIEACNIFSDDCVPSQEAKEPMKDRNLPENIIEVEEVQVQVQVQPLRQTIIETKQLRGRKVSVVLELPPSMVSKKLDSGDPTPAKCVPPEVLVPQELDKVPKPIQAAMPDEDEERLAPSSLSGLGSEDSSAREKVRETLRLFHEACRKILQDEEARPRDGSRFRVDYDASKILKSQGKSLNTGNHIIGNVPGVEVGDEFQYRMELNILGIHRPNQAGIDFIKDDRKELVATSIVASGEHDDELDNVLIYTGQGGYAKKGKKGGKKTVEHEDQQLVMGNLALANSILKKNPVRVIRGSSKKTTLDEKNYVYDGLYLVEEYWQETGSHGKLIFKFRLRRIPGQPELSRKVLKKSNKSEFRDGLCNVDISEGKERLPICAVNELDDEKSPALIYTVKMIYPDWCRPIPPKGCGCTKRCSESKNCACVAKNGGEPPYNEDGDIIKAKPLVYECGPLCKCPPSCYLRSTQRGIKFKLEIFKTESRGWGVRSRNSIPMGSFICEYAGELLEDKEAERLAGKDEYLFDIGKDKDDETKGFTIDAAHKGNIGRFINHSCSPNLYAQDVLYDHEETRIPHVMFFAQNDIPPFEELSYDYNYKIDQVRDSDGNIKKKNCYCGSSKCTGRLY